MTVSAMPPQNSPESGSQSGRGPSSVGSRCSTRSGSHGSARSPPAVRCRKTAAGTPTPRTVPTPLPHRQRLASPRLASARPVSPEPPCEAVRGNSPLVEMLGRRTRPHQSPSPTRCRHRQDGWLPRRLEGQRGAGQVEMIAAVEHAPEGFPVRTHPLGRKRVEIRGPLLLRG